MERHNDSYQNIYGKQVLYHFRLHSLQYTRHTKKRKKLRHHKVGFNQNVTASFVLTKQVVSGQSEQHS